MRPDEQVRAACRRWGEPTVVQRCAQLLAGRPAEGELLALAMALGGLTDEAWLAGGKPPGHSHWGRVWAARALRYVWTEQAAPVVIAALRDEQWRVREMSAKLVGDRELAEAVDLVAALCRDAVPRVRAAATRALGAVGESEHADVLRDLRADPEPVVVAAADRALDTLSRRLDRALR